MDFQGKVAWVTGASSGIGEALAKGLSARGAAVVLSGRRQDALEAVAGKLAGPSLVVPFEATDHDALAPALARVLGFKGQVDLLINNAGISQRSLALDTDFAVYRRLMEVDFFAPVRLTQLVLPHMVERQAGQIAIVSSVAGKVGAPLRTGYSAAKHACVGYFDALRAEVEAAYGIGVSVILPGSVRTGIAANALSADGSARGHSDANIDAGIDPDVAAQTIIDGLAARAHEIVVAEGMELMALQLRAQDPETLFGFTAAEGARLAAARAEGLGPEPTKVNA